jgi:hypothetical protein
MKAKCLNWMLMAALVVGLGTSVTSCKDDDDDEKKENTPENVTGDPMDTDEAQTAWRWLCALTDVQTLDDDWAKKTYEPTVGVASENNQNTRIVIVSDLKEAKSKFAQIADVETSRLGSEYTASQEGVGKMTWTPSPTGAQNLAEVAVDTKLIPHLQKIVYCTEEQTGQNGWFSDNVTGTAYYRFGDVIREQSTGYYWVCVRPSFEQKDKGDSHWIHVFNSDIGAGLPKENILSKYTRVQKYNFNTIMLPTKLKYSREHMTNFSNLIYALLDRDEYATKVGTAGTKNGLGGFDYKYHGVNFLRNVSDSWGKSNSTGWTIWRLLFNLTHDQMDMMEGMTFIYQGYQWRVGNTGYVWEFTTERKNGFLSEIPGSESGDKKLYNFGGNGGGYDIRRYTSDPMADKAINGVPGQFDNNHCYWVVEYKKGSDLWVNGEYSPYEKINGCEDIYCYNKATGNQVHDPLVEDDKVKVLYPVVNLSGKWNNDSFTNRGHYCLGDVLQDQNGHKWFVVNMAGKDDENKEHSEFVYKEAMPYAELISFEGLTTSNNKKYVTNLPTRDQAIRGTMWLWNIFASSAKYTKDEDLKNGTLSSCVLYIKKHANVDIRRLFLIAVGKSGDPRNGSHHVSVGYDNGNNEKQALLRFLYPIDLNNQDVPFHFHAHYVTEPDETTLSYPSTKFSNELIYLNDVANAEKVNKYAKDFYAAQPVTILTGGDGKTRRQFRQVDERADDVTNFYFNQGVWDNYQYKLDMWNEPVLLFRMTRLYDRGDNEYATQTVDGLRMTMIAHDEDRFSKEKNAEYNGEYTSIYAFWNTLLSCFTKDTNLMDGKVMRLPKWDEAWED